MRRLAFILMFCVAAGNVAASAKTVYSFTMKSIDGQQVSLKSYQRQGGAAGERGQQVRIHSAIRGSRGGLREVQGPGPGDRWYPGEQLCTAGAGHERRDQEILQHQVQRVVSR